jgi:hypothetical protein
VTWLERVKQYIREVDACLRRALFKRPDDLFDLHESVIEEVDRKVSRLERTVANLDGRVRELEQAPDPFEELIYVIRGNGDGSVNSRERGLDL